MNNASRVFFDFLWDTPDNRTEYYIQALAGSLFQPLGAYYSARDSVNYMDDYLRNTGLSYGDIKYPSRTIGYNGFGSSAGATVNFVSRSIGRLYR